MLRTDKNGTRVVSVLRARTNLGKLLRQVEDERRARLAAPEPEVLRLIGEESKRHGTDRLTSRQIDRIIKTSRAQKTKR